VHRAWLSPLALSSLLYPTKASKQHTPSHTQKTTGDFTVNVAVAGAGATITISGRTDVGYVSIGLMKQLSGTQYHVNMDTYAGAIANAGLPPLFVDGYCGGGDGANGPVPKSVATMQAMLVSATAEGGVSTIVFTRPLQLSTLSVEYVDIVVGQPLVFYWATHSTREIANGGHSATGGTTPQQLTVVAGTGPVTNPKNPNVQNPSVIEFTPKEYEVCLDRVCLKCAGCNDCVRQAGCTYCFVAGVALSMQCVSDESTCALASNGSAYQPVNTAQCSLFEGAASSTMQSSIHVVVALAAAVVCTLMQ
jgi:hypothetical protein